MSIARTSSDLEQLHNRIAQSKVFGYDTEFSGPLLKFLKGNKRMVNPYTATLTGYSLAFEDDTKFYVPLRHRQGNAPLQAGLELLRFLLGGTHSATAIAHHWQVEYLIASKEQLEVRAKIRDSELEAWLACKASDDPKHPYALKALAKTYLGMEMATFEQTVGQNRSFCDITPEAGEGYATDDAVAALKLANLCAPELRNVPGGWEEYQNVELPFIRVLRHMEDTGVYVDPEAVEKIQTELTPQVDKVRDEFLWLVGADVSSPKSSAILYGDGHWSTEGIETTKKGFKSDKGAVKLHLLRCKEGSLGFEAARLKQEFQTLNKILSTYTWKMVEVAQQYPDGRIHSGYHHTGTRTGRLSSSYINMQQIPVRTELGRRVSTCFVAPEGRSFVTADQSQLEPRVLAHILGKGRLFDAFNKDPLTDTYLEIGKAAGTDRQRAKVLFLAICYRARAKKLSKSLGITIEKSQEMLDTLMTNMPEVPETHDRMIAVAKRRGHIKTLLGRRRILHNINLKPSRENNPLIWADERIACNTPVQGSARDVMTVVMLKFFQEVEKQGELKRIQMDAQIHDDLRLEVDNEVLDDAKRLLQTCMETAMPLKVALVAKPSSGKTWADLK